MKIFRKGGKYLERMKNIKKNEKYLGSEYSKIKCGQKLMHTFTFTLVVGNIM